VFATYLHSLSLIADYLCNPGTDEDEPSSAHFALRAISFLQNIPLPALFYPDFDDPPVVTMPVQEVDLVSATAFATTPAHIYLGCSSVPPAASGRCLSVPTHSHEPFWLVSVSG
jgi:hypothetical protein